MLNTGLLPPAAFRPPIDILPEPVLMLWPAYGPKHVFLLPVVIKYPALYPTITELVAEVADLPEYGPIATLKPFDGVPEGDKA